MRVQNIDLFKSLIDALDISEYRIVTRGAGKTRRRYYNIAASFDTEVSYFVSEGTEKGTTYAMMFSIDNKVEVLVRTWNDTLECMKILHNKFNKAILPVYVHFLSFDFAGLCGWCDWVNTFSIAPHTPIRALCGLNIEFRDSLVFFAKKLETLAEGLDVKKKVGYLDYKLIRHSETPLTEKEIEYCFSDVEVVVAAIQKKMLQYDMAHIPMTKTGEVRVYIEDTLRQFGKTIELTQELKLTNEEYEMAKLAFAGGFTHANAMHSMETLHNVYSYDIITSYIASAVSEYFPVSNGKKVKIKDMTDLVFYLNNYCCVFPITMYNVKLKDGVGDCPISSSRCFNIVNQQLDNGRIYSADQLTTCITELDFKTIQEFYTFDTFDVKYMWVYKRGRLNKGLVYCMLKLYAKKTELKGIEGSEDEYTYYKELLNAVYGCMVMDVVQDLNVYENGVWDVQRDVKGAISKYNNSKKRFLFYLWGVYISAHSRRHLMMVIRETGNDHVYSDTDSEKFIGEEHTALFSQYNDYIVRKMNEAMDYFGFDREMTRPKNNENKKCQLGAFDFEHKYKDFKTLGAKRYLVRTEKNEVILTVAGTGKKNSLIYMLKQTNTKYREEKEKIYVDGDIEKLFDYFDTGLTIPGEYTGKMTHKYYNGEQTFNVTDYTGKTITVTEKGYCFLTPASYSMNEDMEYIEFAVGCKRYRTRTYI